jgi:hypothetical protein
MNAGDKIVMSPLFFEIFKFLTFYLSFFEFLIDDIEIALIYYFFLCRMLFNPSSAICALLLAFYQSLYVFIH